MNNRERAERIWTDLSGRAGCGIDSWEPAIRSECLAMIAEQIEEAVKEALDKMAWGNLEKAAYEKGYAAAREQAAGIASSVDGWHPMGKQYAIEIAEMIRAMTPPGEGK